VKNTGAAAWPATTTLVTSDAMPSQLQDTSWTSPTVAIELGASVAAGATTTLELDVMTPAVTEDTPIQQLFALKAGAMTFGEIPVALTVVIGDPTTSGDPSEGDASGGGGGGGCSAGGGGAGWLAGLVGVALLRRRRATHA